MLLNAFIICTLLECLPEDTRRFHKIFVRRESFAVVFFNIENNGPFKSSRIQNRINDILFGWNLRNFKAWDHISPISLHDFVDFGPIVSNNRRVLSKIRLVTNVLINGRPERHFVTITRFLSIIRDPKKWHLLHLKTILDPWHYFHY